MMRSNARNLVESFEDLRIWQEARGLVREVYTDFGRSTPSRCDVGFRDQIQRAAVSIMNNIAEGFERSTASEFLRFLDFAKGSCGEVRSIYYTAEDLSYIDAPTAHRRRERARGISRGIEALRRHLKRN